MTFGEKVALLRKGKGMSQEELGAELHLSKQAVQKWESGAGMPDISVIMPLAKILGTTTDILLDNEKELPQGEKETVEESQPPLERRRITYDELRKRKTTPLFILLSITVFSIVLGAILMAALQNMVGWIMGGVLLFIAFCAGLGMVLPISMNVKRFLYNGHEIIGYAGASQHYLIIDEYVHDFLEAEGIIKDRYLKGKVDGKEVVMTLTWSNNVTIKIDGETIFPEK